MWEDLPKSQRDEYKKLILALASLTKAFAQKAEDTDVNLSPIIFSKYQETVFQKAFNASAEDIGNTAYDAAIYNSANDTKYLIGIKTFGISAGAQKIAQFKAYHNEWSEAIKEIYENAFDVEGNPKSKDEINKINKDLYIDLAKRISEIRNTRIESAKAQIHGFSISIETDNVQSVYHILMPSSKDGNPKIFVGETTYDKIDIDKIQLIGCTAGKTPTNFEFTDGHHKYKFTSADSQLLMDFNNAEIVLEEWPVKFSDNAQLIFAELAEKIYGKQMFSNEQDIDDQFFEIPKPLCESHSWLITNPQGEVELFSGFNSFFGVGSKIGKEQREHAIKRLEEKYTDLIKPKTLSLIIDSIEEFLFSTPENKDERLKKVRFREKILEYVEFACNNDLKTDVQKLLFRPQNELYIPIPNSKEFHKQYPDFFAKGAGEFKPGTVQLAKPPSEREFNLVFEPSGATIKAFICQDAGKAIESVEKQSYLGEWILKGVFQLNEYEPLTSAKMNEAGINGLKFTKYKNSDDIHAEFIWIDREKTPDDYWK